MLSPTARTLQALRSTGWIADVVERRVPRCNITRDLFGFADIVAISGRDTGVLAVQATTSGNLAARAAKVRAAPAARVWLEAGNRIQCWGWGQYKRGKRRLWRPRIIELLWPTQGWEAEA